MKKTNNHSTFSNIYFAIVCHRRMHLEDYAEFADAPCCRTWR